MTTSPKGSRNSISVFADWLGPDRPKRYGVLHANTSGNKDVFEFEFDSAALDEPLLTGVSLDPRILPFAGSQFPSREARNFGVFLDASPDRWGRTLMRRRRDRQSRDPSSPASPLREFDYLLGVHDQFRIGALRFSTDGNSFLASDSARAAPPFVSLRELEQASRNIEENRESPEKLDEWLRVLIAPGGSLGGARPKASVQDPLGNLWIAKFPSVNDEYDVGAWEHVLHTMAAQCGLRVPVASVDQFASDQHTFLVRRFDRDGDRRIHFASAMTMTEHDDGDDESTGSSYFEIVNFLMSSGASAIADLQELWSRIVFNMCVSNADDHFRNHGFLLEPGVGWSLSPAYDMNPVPTATGLKLNVNESDNALDLELSRSVAGVFRVKDADARSRIADIQAVVRTWGEIAKAHGLSRREIEQMAPAFRLANSS